MWVVLCTAAAGRAQTPFGTPPGFEPEMGPHLSGTSPAAVTGNEGALKDGATWLRLSDLPAEEQPPPMGGPFLSPPARYGQPLLPAPGASGPLIPGLPGLEEPPRLFTYEEHAPLGYAGPSGVLPQEYQSNNHFVPMEDRWRIGFPRWDRYGKGHPPVDDYPYVEGSLWDPYNQNVLKGDYPILGQHLFLKITAQSNTIIEGRQVPTATTPFESTLRPDQEEFFGDPDQYFANQNFLFSVDLFHGDAAFKPFDWRVKVTPIFNLNHLVADELAVVSPNVLAGQSRFRQDFALEEYFVEVKLADLSPNYDFVSMRAGSQFFVSDFRGFIFADTNRAVRLFGTRHANRDQFNVLFVDQQEKDTNSLLNTFDDRHQNTIIVNYYRQDFIWPGYTAQWNFHFNHDRATVKFDNNGFLVRPDPVGIFAPHDIKSYYFGWTGNGHINRINISHAFYYVFGVDDLNPLAGSRQDIDAYMAALELSYDRDWVRFRSSYFFSSGDPDPNDEKAEGFDAIFDNPAFAGGEFSYWQRQTIRLFGVNLTNRMSLVPNLRSSKFQGQTNFVNPGLHLFNLGMDADLTPKLKLIHNTNFLWFDQTEVLEQFVFQGDIRSFIGTDVSFGVEYRPLLNNNVILVGGVSGLFAGAGFQDLFRELEAPARDLFAGFVNCILEY
ncbi:MAG: hypothetical protein KatS3mg110_0807 [Pirellulaceae bacterium]|nr:MAG: hypothetical protein KatS3mg110_0807 [Pirellulaceae bacterium]